MQRNPKNYLYLIYFILYFFIISNLLDATFVEATGNFRKIISRVNNLQPPRRSLLLQPPRRSLLLQPPRRSLLQLLFFPPLLPGQNGYVPPVAPPPPANYGHNNPIVVGAPPPLLPGQNGYVPPVAPPPPANYGHNHPIVVGAPPPLLPGQNGYVPPLEQLHADIKINQQIYIAKSIIQAVERKINNMLYNSYFTEFKKIISENNRKILKNTWIFLFYEISKQRNTKTLSSYDAEIFGSGIETHFLINDNTMIRLLYGYFLSNFKYNNLSKQNDHSKGHVLSTSSQSKIGNNLLWHNELLFSFNKINRKMLQGILYNNNQQVTANFNSHAFSIETALAYKISITDHLFIIPKAGLRLRGYYDSAYIVEGLNTNYNSYIPSRSDISFSSIIGSKLIARKEVSHNTEFIFTFNTSIEQYSINKETTTKAKFIHSNHYFESKIKQRNREKISYNIGSSISISHKNIIISTMYNYHLYKKYHAHQGCLKFKILL